MGFLIGLFLFDVNLDSLCQLLRSVLITTRMSCLRLSQDHNSHKYVSDGADEAQNKLDKFTKLIKIRSSQGIFES